MEKYVYQQYFSASIPWKKIKFKLALNNPYRFYTSNINKTSHGHYHTFGARIWIDLVNIKMLIALRFCDMDRYDKYVDDANWREKTLIRKIWRKRET